LLLLCGETGTGKTTLCRGVLEALGDRTFSAIILNPYMTGAEVLRVVLRDFGFISREEIRRGAFAHADAPQLLDALEGFLHALLPLDAHAIVVIDEAQSLAPQVLDQIRRLTAFEDEGRRLVQVVLVGQPTLLNTLKTEPLYALNERITRRAMLTPLERSEVESYIQHRLEIAGAGEAVSFDPEAARLVADLSRGLPRRVNVIAIARCRKPHPGRDRAQRRSRQARRDRSPASPSRLRTTRRGPSRPGPTRRRPVVAFCSCGWPRSSRGVDDSHDRGLGTSRATSFDRTRTRRRPPRSTVSAHSSASAARAVGGGAHDDVSTRSGQGTGIATFAAVIS
jgi:type II secretory pathway predicted ATPase ExeA